MSIIESEYEEVQRQRASFLTGSNPAWLTENVTGGGSATYSSDNGGRATLSTGTSAGGDGIRLEFSPVRPGFFDAVALRATIEHDPSATTDGVCNTELSLISGGNKVGHAINNATSSKQDTVRNEGASNPDILTRQITRDDATEIAVIWDATNDRIIDRCQETFAREVSGANANYGQDYTAGVSIETWDTAADRLLYVYDFEVAYYKLK